CAEMRRAVDLFVLEEGVIGVEGLLDEDIHRGARDLPGLKRLLEGLLIDDPTTRGVDEIRRLLHFLERCRVDEVRCFGRKGGMNRDEIRPLEELIEAHELDSKLGRSLARHEGIHSDDLHLQALGAIGHNPTDVAETDDAERLMGKLTPLEFTLLPLPRAG